MRAITTPGGRVLAQVWPASRLILGPRGGDHSQWAARLPSPSRSLRSVSSRRPDEQADSMHTDKDAVRIEESKSDVTRQVNDRHAGPKHATDAKKETIAERDARLAALFADREGGSASYGSVDGDQLYGGMGTQTKRNMFRVI